MGLASGGGGQNFLLCLMVIQDLIFVLGVHGGAFG